VAQEKLLGSSDWVPVTPVSNLFFFAFWSARSDLIYTLSSHAHGGNLRFLDAQRLDPETKHPAGTGKLLWQTKMTTSSNAGPTTYIGKDGRQYVVIAAGGPGNARRRSANDNFVFHQTLVAFALPKPNGKEINIITPYPKREPQPGDDMGLAQ